MAITDEFIRTGRRLEKKEIMAVTDIPINIDNLEIIDS